MSILSAFDLNEQQHAAVVERARDVTVTAGAGSGKTRTLVARYVSLLAEGHPPRAVVAVTFTEKAAREMRNRIRQAVQDWRTGPCPPAARPHWEEIEAEIETARIGTIHSLCAALLRAHPAEAACDPRFAVLDEGLAATLKAQVVEAALAWAQTQPPLLPLFQAFTLESLSASLGQLLNTAVDETWLTAPTAALVERWQAKVFSALQAFTTAPAIAAAVADLRALQRDRQLVADAGDKLAAQVQGLLEQWALLEAALAQRQNVALAECLFTLRRDYCGGRAGKVGVAKEAVKLLRETYDEQLDPWLGGADKKDSLPDAALESQLPALLAALGQLWVYARTTYQKAKDQRQALDFDDLETKAALLLRDPALCARWQAQVAAVLVDEFQDTNPRQRQIVEALAGARGRLFIVGDAKQSIYRFRGADVAVFRGLSAKIQAQGGLDLDLATTFRAHSALVAALNELLAPILTQAAPATAAYAVPFAPLVAARADPRAALTAPFVEILVAQGTTVGAAAHEGRMVAAQRLAHHLGQLHDAQGVAWNEMALLFRASTGFAVYEAALEAAGIPFVTVAGRGFYDRPEVRDVLNLLRALADPWDDLALAGLLRSPAFGLSDTALYQLRYPPTGETLSYYAALGGDLAHLAALDQTQAQRASAWLAEFTALVDRVPVAELLARVLDRTHYAAILAAEPHGARLQRNLEKLLADAHASGLLRVREFLEYIDTLQAAGAREGEAPTEAGGAVRLLTVHKAKGLEFPVVVLADAARAPHAGTSPVLVSSELGWVPRPQTARGAPPPLIYRLAHALEKSQAAAEEARLLYVALTRAQEKLIISGHITDRTSGWLGQLCAAAGVNLAQLSVPPGAWQTFTLPVSGQPIAVCVQQSWAEVGVSVETIAKTAPPPSPAAIPLVTPLQVTLDPEENQERITRHLRRVTGLAHHADGTVVGTLVHAALRRWCFPRDPALARLLVAAAKEAGVVQPADLDSHVARAEHLLARLPVAPQWAEVVAAHARGAVHHEVPYTQPHSRGIVDLLYRAPDGLWQVLDFKTDAIETEAQLTRLLVTDYRTQLARYRQALTQLLGAPVQTHLVLLDYLGRVQWRLVM